MYQTIAWYATLFFVFLISLAFSFVFGESKRLKDYAPIQEKGYKIRKYYFLCLVAILGLSAAISLTKLPYHSQTAEAASNLKIVNVTGQQFSWNLSQDTFTVGDSVEFRVTSKDVTHGFGIYDPNMKIIGQVQAMPEYTNTEYVTFKKAGTYKILCLEYCSTGHHLMVKDIIVKPKGGK
ncbi:MAG: cytochrome c oxidase subunit II [Bacillota bacterium]|nr:cytochrome c oxidase subunit II [Bacillota bacterium]